MKAKLTRTWFYPKQIKNLVLSDFSVCVQMKRLTPWNWAVSKAIFEHY